MSDGIGGAMKGWAFGRGAGNVCAGTCKPGASGKIGGNAGGQSAGRGGA
jgi:hypothetical protein